MKEATDSATKRTERSTKRTRTIKNTRVTKSTSKRRIRTETANKKRDAVHLRNVDTQKRGDSR